MNEKQAELMLKHLKRMEQLLEAIDWKLWDFHQKTLGAEDTTSTKKNSTDLDELAEIIEKPDSKLEKSEEKKVSFPSVENWS